jgi:hypothetical protein
VILRDGWGPDATWIEFSCGPYFAKHDHLDTNQFQIYHRGNLALDTGADYTDTESPHYLNYYRRTIAHNTMLVVPARRDLLLGREQMDAANDGGQRMDSSRFWNSVRSLKDWSTRATCGTAGTCPPSDPCPWTLHVRARRRTGLHPSKVESFVRDLAWLPHARRPLRPRSLCAARIVAPARPGCCTRWSEPKVEGGTAGARHRQGGTALRRSPGS